MNEPATDTTTSLAVKIGAWIAMALLALLLFATWWAADVIGPLLFGSAAPMLRETSLSESVQGALMYVVFLLVPVCLVAIVYWMTRRNDTGTWARLFAIAIAAGMAVPREVTTSALPVLAADMYLGLMKLQLVVMGALLGVWVLFRLVRWLVRDERSARSSSEQPS